jgi:hypothetical protein
MNDEMTKILDTTFQTQLPKVSDFGTINGSTLLTLTSVQASEHMKKQTNKEYKYS